MSKQVHIPFLLIFKEPMLAGIKTTTARTRKYGKPGDTFHAWGQVFEIREVTRVFLSSVRNNFYQQEGFPSPKAFELCWKALHPIKGYVPKQVVYAHSFKKLEKIDQLAKERARDDAGRLQRQG